MTTIAMPTLGGILLAVNFLAALACHSLRDFSRSRLEEICRGHHREQRFSTILKLYEHALLAAELVQIVALIALVTTAALWFGQPLWGQLHLTAARWRFFCEVLILVPVLYFVSIMLPWTLARVAGETFLYHTWPVLSGLMTLAAPLIWVTREFDALIHRMFGMKPIETDDVANITEEIRTVVDEGQREGILESEARTMIHRVIGFQEVDVADIMTPRTAMVCIAADDTLDSARQILLEEGHSRVPVIGKTTDDILGMLYAKDLLRHLSPREGDAVPLSQIAREPFYVPETMGIDTLLKSFKKERVHLAIVLDEYGGVAGLVTMEDILEEIVGEIVDEYDPAVADQFRLLAPGVFEVDARAHIDDVNERLSLELPADRDFDTVGGFVFSLLGRIPVKGEEFRWERLRFTVLEADKRRIVRLRIENEGAGAAPSGAAANADKGEQTSDVRPPQGAGDEVPAV